MRPLSLLVTAGFVALVALLLRHRLGFAAPSLPVGALMTFAVAAFSGPLR